MIADPNRVLTPRQLELLALYASGDTLPEIANKKFLSYSSVQQTLGTARERVGARSLTHLVAIAIEARVIVKNGIGYKPVQEERVVGE